MVHQFASIPLLRQKGTLHGRDWGYRRSFHAHSEPLSPSVLGAEKNNPSLAISYYSHRHSITRWWDYAITRFHQSHFLVVSHWIRLSLVVIGKTVQVRSTARGFLAGWAQLIIASAVHFIAYKKATRIPSITKRARGTYSENPFIPSFIVARLLSPQY